MKQLANQLNWKAARLRARIGELEGLLAASDDAPDVLLKRQELKGNFALLISHDHRCYHTIREAGEMAAAGAVQARRLLEKELETARKNLALIERVLEAYREDDLLALLEQLPKAYRGVPWDPEARGPGASSGHASGALVSEAELSDREWVEANTERNPNFPEHRNVRTSFGLMVRSKSERLIAEYLWRSGLPFRYEPEIELIDGDRIMKWYPDFQIRIGRELTIFWEHLGKMDDPDYIARNLPKLKVIFENGAHIGGQLVLTMEEKAHPLDVSYVIAQVEMLKSLARKCSSNEPGSANYNLKVG